MIKILFLFVFVVLFAGFPTAADRQSRVTGIATEVVCIDDY